MTSIAHKLSYIVGQAFEAEGLPAELGNVRVSDRPDLAQFQCNGAMAAAKLARKAPRQVAEAMMARLDGVEGIKKLEIAGPGFLNIDVEDNFIINVLAKNSQSEKAGLSAQGAGQTVVLDYGGPNIAKPMHVGHLRASIIGDALRRMFAAAGYKTIGDVHMGDWGTHLGMLFSDYERAGKIDWVLGIDLDNETDVQALFEDMSARYPQASAACKADEDLMAQAHKITKAMQDKEEPYISLWQKIRDVSVIGMRANFDALGVHFDLWNGEASVHDLIAPMVEDLKEKGCTRESDGALVFDVAREDDKKEVPPLILYKRDGAVMYGTTDLATLVERMNDFSP